MNLENNLFARARDCLLLEDVEEKCRQTERLYLQWQQGRLQIDAVELEDVAEAGSAAETERVRPAQLAKRGFHSLQGRAAMVHAITHIEFSAITWPWMRFSVSVPCRKSFTTTGCGWRRRR